MGLPKVCCIGSGAWLPPLPYLGVSRGALDEDLFPADVGVSRSRADLSFCAHEGPLGALDKQVADLTATISGKKAEYRALMGKIVQIENKQRSIFLLAKDASYLEKIKEV